MMRQGKRYWNREADRHANVLSDVHFNVHRGATACPTLPGVSVVFGNDGWEGESSRAQKEVQLLRERLAAQGIEELGFGLNDDFYTWAILCRTQDVDFLSTAVWDCWREAVGRNADDPEWQAFFHVQRGQSLRGELNVVAQG
jgi:hypothetical protein